METLLKILIPILIQIESGGNNNAIGDGGRAVGCLQIHKIMVDDVNRITAYRKDIKCDSFTYDDRYDEIFSRSMCIHYLNHYGPKRISKDNTELENLVILGRMWNAGPNGYKKKCTLPYARKIRKLYRTEKNNASTK